MDPSARPGRSRARPRSKFVRTTRARKIDVRFAKQMPYELDGGARGSTKKLRIRVHPLSVEVCVPEPDRADA